MQYFQNVNCPYSSCFLLSLFTQSICIKWHLFSKFQVFRERSSSSNYIVSSFQLFYLDLPLFTQSVCIKDIFCCGLFFSILVRHQLLKCHILYSCFLKISLAPSRKQRCYFSHDGPPCRLYFQGIVCTKPCLLILICQFVNSMSKTDLFYKFFTCEAL